jgi:hypothetical protein
MMSTHFPDEPKKGLSEFLIQKRAILQGRGNQGITRPVRVPSRGREQVIPQIDPPPEG